MDAAKTAIHFRKFRLAASAFGREQPSDFGAFLALSLDRTQPPAAGVETCDYRS
jgi:hypothetical protein